MKHPSTAPWALGFILATACSRGEAELQVSPQQGPLQGGTVLRLEGQGFAGRGPLSVYVGDAHARGIVVEGDRSIRLVTPEAKQAGTVAIQLWFGDGEIQEIPQGFTYEQNDKAIVITPK